MGIDNPVHLLFLGVIALVVLGPRRLPELAKALGKGMREFREAMSDGTEGGFERPYGAEDAPQQPALPPPAQSGAPSVTRSTQPPAAGSTQPPIAG